MKKERFANSILGGGIPKFDTFLKKYDLNLDNF